jgi:hypothetical protein
LGELDRRPRGRGLTLQQNPRQLLNAQGTVISRLFISELEFTGCALPCNYYKRREHFLHALMRHLSGSGVASN